jgi:hypothetical protein
MPPRTLRVKALINPRELWENSTRFGQLFPQSSYWFFSLETMVDSHLCCYSHKRFERNRKCHMGMGELHYLISILYYTTILRVNDILKWSKALLLTQEFIKGSDKHWHLSDFFVICKKYSTWNLYFWDSIWMERKCPCIFQLLQR